MAPIYSLKERRPRADRAPSISIAFQGEKIVRASGVASPSYFGVTLGMLRC